MFNLFETSENNPPRLIRTGDMKSLRDFVAGVLFAATNDLLDATFSTNPDVPEVIATVRDGGALVHVYYVVDAEPNPDPDVEQGERKGIYTRDMPVSPFKVMSVREVLEDATETDNYWDRDLGYTIDGVTQQGERVKLSLLIDAERSCCESFGATVRTGTFARGECGHGGYIDSQPEEVNALLGATVTGLRVVCQTPESDDGDREHVLFIELTHDRGVTTFTVYNQHDGYYGHSAKVVLDGAEIYSGVL